MAARAYNHQLEYDITWQEQIYLTEFPNWTAESDQAGSVFGSAVGTAGDVNDDGYSDVIIGAHEYDNGQSGEGRVFVYYGEANGLAQTPGWTAESDQLGAHFGLSVGTAGDVNGDGYSDVIVGAPYGGGGMSPGQAYVYYGSASGLSSAANWMVTGDQDGANFGWAVGTAGDVNGDNYDDVIVSSLDYDNGQSHEGRVFVYHGAAAGLSTNPAWMVESNLDYAGFGQSVGTAGDVNGDGYADVIIGAPGYDNVASNEGRAYVYHGAASGLSLTPDWTVESGEYGARLGESVGTAGDVNGDGYSDIVIGAPNYNVGEGRAYVYHGTASGLLTSPAWTADGGQDDPNFGASVGTAGDTDGDNYDEVIVGAYDFNNGQLSEGGAFVFYGAAGGLPATPSWTAESDQLGAYLGQAVGKAGDVNDDGYADVIIGAPGYSNGQISEGRAYVYHGTASESLIYLPLLTRRP
ncbi:MAG: integrin alpha [Chloroflexota bacterium]